ncbi:serine/threonine protein kinase [Nonomuraea sp. NBC_01738]|uniref:serine/threonine-protein kinase n=1 Tax=Nonomuraea sp. NBC_01738 TaxID=2976003 RepID=UPI002E0F451E|nr:serine/threonine protein kinase [Nonomuraea sp. NBC_01738]
MRRRVIDGRFELVERLGGGGMGLVWQALDTALQRDVALKEVRPPDPTLDEHDPEAARELRARVIREARALARINHPHVVTIHHIVDNGDDAYPWIVMELVSGGSLQDRLTQGPMSVAQVTRLGREVLSALRAAHAVGIQHRDVKPANVLIHPDGRSVLTDFGIAAVRESTSLTATGSFIGSPEYIAPERINGHEGDPSSDLWSLGMLLYIAVEGRHPLRRATTLATLAAVLNQEVPQPMLAGPLTPVLNALLRRDPAARPDAETLDRMLAAVESGSPLPHQPWPQPQPPMPPQSGPPQSRPPQSGPQQPGQQFQHGGQTVPPYAGATVPPYAQQASPPFYGAQTGPPMTYPTGPTQRSGKRGAGKAVAALAVAGVVTAGIVVVALLPTMKGDTATDRPTGTAAAIDDPAGTKQPTKDPTTDSPTQEEEAPANLLTPAGLRMVAAKLKEATGSSNVYRMSVHPEFASAEGPVKGERGIYDRYSYRDGQVTRDGAGGSTKSRVPADLSKFDWSKLPALFKKAEQELGVKKPTSRYLIIEPAFEFGGTRQTMMIYLNDDYRTAYLVADVNGKILRYVKA